MVSELCALNVPNLRNIRNIRRERTRSQTSRELRFITSSNANTYVTLEQQIQEWTTERDTIAGQMKAMLEEAAFDGQSIDENQAKSLIAQGQNLLNQVATVTNSL
jgi:hypothetical protein